MIRLVISDLGGGNKKVLYETSRHPNGSFGLERNSLDGLTWSPDGQYIVFAEGMPGIYQAKIANVLTEEVNNLGVSGEAGIYLSWAPSGEAIATNSPDVLDTLNILSTRGESTQKELVGSWNIIRGLDWSPNGKTIVFAGNKDDALENLKLYTLEVGTQKISQLPLDENLSYELPKWSPDGKLIAANARSGSPGIVDRLLIYDAEHQEVVATLEGKRSSWDFYWSDDSQTILLTKGFPPDPPRTVELFYWQEDRTEVIPFPEGVEDGVAIGISSE
jgi:Tol biopolymer transport system component